MFIEETAAAVDKGHSCAWYNGLTPAFQLSLTKHFTGPPKRFSRTLS